MITECIPGPCNYSLRHSSGILICRVCGNPDPSTLPKPQGTTLCSTCRYTTPKTQGRRTCSACGMLQPKRKITKPLTKHQTAMNGAAHASSGRHLSRS